MLKRVAAGGAFTLIGQVGKVVLQATAIVVLARLLTPDEFGTFALVTAIVALGELFRDFGLTAAAIQTRVLTHQQANTVFWLSSTIGLILMASIGLLSGAIAEYFRQPLLRPLLPITSVVFVLYGCQAIYQVLLARRLEFRTLALTDLIAQVVGLSVAVFAARLNAGVWSLVFQLLATNMVLLATRIVAARWLPSRPRIGPEVRSLLTYGVNLFGAHLLTYISTKAYTFAISLQLGTGPLGVFDRAYTLVRLPVTQILAPLTNVVLPVLSQTDAKHDMYEKLFSLQVALCSIATLAFALLVPLAPEVVLLALGEQWHEAAPIFQILAVGGVFSMFSYVSYWAFLARGLTHTLLRYNLVTKSATLILVVAASFYNLNAVAAAYAISLLISWPVNVLWLGKVDGFPARRFLGNGLHIIVSGGVTSSVVFAGKSFSSSPLEIVLTCLLAVGVFLICIMLSTRTRSVMRMLWGLRPTRGDV